MPGLRLNTIKEIVLLLSIFGYTNGWAVDTLVVKSPSGIISVEIWMEKQLNYRVLYDRITILEPSQIDLIVENKGTLSSNNSIRSSSIKEIREQISSPVPEKRKIIPNEYNILSIVFRKPYKVEFKVYNDGLAYRISTSFKDPIIIQNEVAEFNFPGHPSAYFPQVKKIPDRDIFHTSFEEEYSLKSLDSLSEGILGYSPILVVPGTYPLIAITESDLEDYPGMFLGGTGSARLKGVFAGYPLEEAPTEAVYPNIIVTKRAPYIAKTNGTRTFPWRVLLIAADDKDLPGNDIVYRLGAPSKIGDASWIKPGNLTDEWITGVNLFNVPFKAGVNTASYKYYIDFAKRFGFDRIMMDAGWSDVNDLFKINPDINMDTLVAYAKQKEVGISMWTLSSTLDRQLESALEQFNKWGVDFIMTDFMDRG